MGYHRNTLIHSDEGKSKVYNTDHNMKISLVTIDDIRLVTPEDRFVCHAQFIMTSRDQGRKLGLDISRIFTDHNFNIIGRHMNTLLPDEGSNKVSKPDLDVDSKHNIDITHFSKYLCNDPLNPNTNAPSSNCTCKDYVTHTTPPKDRKESQPGRISCKEGNRSEDLHLTPLQE